jgi:hypothetical protein
MVDAAGNASEQDIRSAVQALTTLVGHLPRT